MATMMMPTNEVTTSPNSRPSTAGETQHEMEKQTAKRDREKEGEGEHAVASDKDARSPKRIRIQDILYRIVVPSSQIGKVIGKLGARVQKIRQETKATIKIADAIAPFEERVIIISSKDNDDTLCDAQNALHQITSLILKEDTCSETMEASLDHAATHTIKLLIAGCQAGPLIGTSGQSIQKLRNSSGATIVILEHHQLPFCVSAHESDRVVQISGEVPTLMKAIQEIGCQLRENPPPQAFAMNPTSFSHSVTRAARLCLDATAADYVTFQMVVPESIIGGLIGRSGSNISRIRKESGASIKVHGGKGLQNVRQIDFSGTIQQVTLAKQRVDEYIYSQKMSQSAPAGYHEPVNVNLPAVAPPFPALPNISAAPHPGLPSHQPSIYYGTQQYF